MKEWSWLACIKVVKRPNAAFAADRKEPRPLKSGGMSKKIMKIPAKLRRKWELKFPNLSGKWSHWKTVGDGILIDIVSGLELVKALDVVQHNFSKFASIKVCRAVVDEDEIIIEEEKTLFEISNQIFNKREFNLFENST